MTDNRTYTEAILEAYIALFNERWPNGISEEEKQDLEALGRKEGEINKQIRQEYYKSQKEREVL